MQKGRVGDRTWTSRAAVCGAMLLAVLGGCSARRRYVAPETPMPANTILLSQMMRELSSQPGFTEAMLRQIGGGTGTKNGPALLTPQLVNRMRDLIVGKNWQGLDRFPGWTMREINPTVRVVGHYAGKDEVAEELASRPGATAASPRKPSAKEISGYVDLGTLSLAESGMADLNQPSRLPGFTEQGLVNAMGFGVTRGDGADPAIAPMHAESDRLAQLLNRLSLNGVAVDGANKAKPYAAKIGDLTVTTPEALIDALAATGHQVIVADARYFANFGHFHYRAAGATSAEDVMMPFWVNTQIRIPESGRPLLVPVIHAEYEWFIRGPRIDADVAWYFGIDGKAEFRTMDELNQPWVLGRHAHEYRGADAREVTRLTGRMVVAYVHEHIAHPHLPFGGYYALGVCQDAVAAIEQKLTGRSTLFPNTADAAFFNDPRDAEINRLIAAIPKDRDGGMPEPERIFGSLPTEDDAQITIPGLGDDLRRSREAWRNDTLHRMPGARHTVIVVLEVLGAGLAVVTVGLLELRRRRAGTSRGNAEVH